MGLKPGENAQYDDIGQMTLMRRAGLFLLSLDGPDTSQQGAQGKAGDSGGQQQNVERMVSLRHVEKKKQERKKSGQGDSGGGGGASAASAEQQAAQGGQQQQQDFKHEGESVNTEIRCTKGRIEFRSGDTVVGYYDKGKDAWYFKGRIVTHGIRRAHRDHWPDVPGSRKNQAGGAESLDHFGSGEEDQCAGVKGLAIGQGLPPSRRRRAISGLETNDATAFHRAVAFAP